jgi:SPP1 gp7 family putative phage head morphogenesis protein
MARSSSLVAQLTMRRAITSASSKRRRARKPPAAQAPTGVALAYQRELRRYAEGFWATALEILAPHLEALAGSGTLSREDAREVRLDSPKLIGRLIKDIAVAHGVRFPESAVSQMALRFGKRAAEHNREQVNRQFRAVLGVDLPEPATAIGQQLEAFRTQNVNLITRTTAENLHKIQELLERRSRQGARVEDLRRELVEQQGFSKSRAELIARDQVLKFNGELTQVRHREAGVDRYEWSTSGDERVREEHAALDGTIHRWDDPPVVDKKRNRRHHPGEDFQCRCTAIPVIEF